MNGNAFTTSTDRTARTMERHLTRFSEKSYNQQIGCLTSNRTLQNCYQKQDHFLASFLYSSVEIDHEYSDFSPNESSRRHIGDSVCRQSFWNQMRLKLRESLAHLIGLIMQRVACDASAAFRVSFV